MDEPGDSTFPNWPEFRRLFAYDNLLGKVLQGRYEIVRRLGAGGMGVVFLARHVHLDKHFALKIISPRFLDEPEIGQRFLLEARAASKIDHANVVSITDFGPPEEGPAFFAMEYLEGEDLAHLLAREGPLPWPRVLPIAAQIARALAAAHQRGVVHRDIKPQNCFRVTRDDNPEFIKVLDFGLAKVLSGAAHSAWTVGGSPGYIAPEIYRGGKTDHRVDIYALGALMHTLLIGRLPAQSPEDVTLPPGAPVLHTTDLPPPLRALISRATHEDPDQRHATAEALLLALDEAREAIHHPSTPPPTKPTARPRWPLLAAAGLLTTLALAWTSPWSSPVPSDSLTTSPAPLAPAPSDSLTAAPDSATAPAPSDSLTTAPDSPTAPAPSDSLATAPDSPTAPAPSDGLTATPDTPAPSDQPVPPDSPATPAASDSPPLAPASTSPSPAASDSPPAPAPSASPRRSPPAFDELSARALLQRQTAPLAACKAASSFSNMSTHVRLDGQVTVGPRGRASVVLPPGYDVNACIERLVAGLRFRPSLAGGSFTHRFLL